MPMPDVPPNAGFAAMPMRWMTCIAIPSFFRRYSIEPVLLDRAGRRVS